MPEPLVICDNLVKIYKVADLEVVALQGLDLEVSPGEMIAIVGVSGSGKTTLLNILSGLDLPSAGKCLVDGNDLTRLSRAQRINYERFTVGHVWQQSGRNLLPELSIQANVELPQVLGGVEPALRARRARELLELVGLAGMGQKRPDQLSGGEQQRAAIAVALANQPKLLLGDEPTGELDSATAGEILALLRSLNRQLGLTIILVTHDVAIASVVDRTIAIRDGRTSTETVRRERRWGLSANIRSRPALSLACQARPIANRSSLTALVASNSQKKRLKASLSTGERRYASSTTTWSYGLLAAAAK